MNTTIYSNNNSGAYTQLSRLAIAKLTSGKRLNGDVFTAKQLHNIQRFANGLPKNKDKDFVIAYN